MLLSIIQKSKSIIGLKNSQTSQSNVTQSPQSSADDPQCQSHHNPDKSDGIMLSEDTQNGHREFQELIYDYIRGIKDPEKPATLEDLHVVYEDGVKVKGLTPGNVKIVHIEFIPTVPHCSLATLIGLCIRVQLERTVGHLNPIKLNIFIKKGSHNTEEEINKQINDKERIAAAMENPNLKKIVEDCIKDDA